MFGLSCNCSCSCSCEISFYLMNLVERFFILCYFHFHQQLREWYFLCQWKCVWKWQPYRMSVRRQNHSVLISCQSWIMYNQYNIYISILFILMLLFSLSFINSYLTNKQKCSSLPTFIIFFFLGLFSLLLNQHSSYFFVSKNKKYFPYSMNAENVPH